MATIDKAALFALPPDQRLRLADELFGSVYSTTAGVAPSDEVRQELDRRLDDLESRGSQGRTWPEVRAELEARLRTLA